MDNKQLLENIMEYWNQCVNKNGDTDFKVNDLVDKFALSCGIDERKLESDVFQTVSNMTSSQKRKLWKILNSSNIL